VTTSSKSQRESAVDDRASIEYSLIIVIEASSEFGEHSLEFPCLVRDSVPFVKLFQRVDNRGYLLAVLIGHIQEVNNLTDGGVLENEHVFGENLNQSEEAPFRIVPGICIDLSIELFVPSSVWVQAI
jgi:hypothetical protein